MKSAKCYDKKVKALETAIKTAKNGDKTVKVW